MDFLHGPGNIGQGIRWAEFDMKCNNIPLPSVYGLYNESKLVMTPFEMLFCTFP